MARDLHRTRWAVLALALGLGACNDNDGGNDAAPAPIDGQAVFRYETFGNEDFWSLAMRLPQGIIGAQLTPLQALSLGLNVDATVLDPAFAQVVVAEIDKVKNGMDPATTALASPAVTLELIKRGAVLGVVPFGPDGKRLPLGREAGFDANATVAKVGVSCALCHSRTDDSIVPAGFAGLKGSVGAPVDGITAEGLDVGAIFAASQNPLAYLPFLQVQYAALGGATLGRGSHPGIDMALLDSTTLSDAQKIEQLNAQARSYLTGTYMRTEDGEVRTLRHYPLTSFDSTPDGIGSATYTPPFFRTDLAAPWGSSGSFKEVSDFNNLVYTVALDPTSLLTPAGRGLLTALAGPVGTELATRYEQVLRLTGVLAPGQTVAQAFPYVDAARSDLTPGSQAGPAGRRVDEARLAALKVYTDRLASPPAPAGLNTAQVTLGEQVFTRPRSEGGGGCTNCHTASASGPVENNRIRSLVSLYPDYAADLVLLMREPALFNVQKTTSGPSPDYDLSLVVLDASLRSGDASVSLPMSMDGSTALKPGYAKPLLLGLAGKDEFLHDGSVRGPTGYLPSSKNAALDWLLNPQRGARASHPFFFPGPTQSLDGLLGGGDGSAGRDALVQYLLSRTAMPAASATP